MKIVIVGLGVIGASYALALKDLGYKEVYGIDIDKDTIKKAKDMEIIKEGYEHGYEILNEIDLVILSIYPTLIKDFIIQNDKNFKRGAIITDTTGIKGMFMGDVIEILPNDVDFIFGHPMAGREKRGISYASKDVFKDANYLIIKNKNNKQENIKFIKNLAHSMGFNNIKEIDFRFHDEIIAFTSQLPHVIAVSLINSDKENRDTGKFIGDSYRDLTRIANINEDLWSELFIGNKNNLIKCIDDFSIELNRIRDYIKNEETNKLKEEFIKSTKRRDIL